jgi:hypothetical protein
MKPVFMLLLLAPLLWLGPIAFGVMLLPMLFLLVRC